MVQVNHWNKKTELCKKKEAENFKLGEKKGCVGKVRWHVCSTDDNEPVSAPAVIILSCAYENRDILTYAGTDNLCPQVLQRDGQKRSRPIPVIFD